jgi:drug/metabolite transporter (DMT)-like permease
VPTSDLQNQLKLHFIVFIWGFTAVLGALISLDYLSLTWYRLLIAVFFLSAGLFFRRKKVLPLNKKFIKITMLNGFLIGMHWLFFFKAIKTGGVSVTLVSLSSGALFTSFLEPFFYKRKFRKYEFIFGAMITGVMIWIFGMDGVHPGAVLYGMAAAFLGALFSVINGMYIHHADARWLSLFELGFAWLLLSFILAFSNEPGEIFHVKPTDWIWLALLGSICTAYAFTESLDLLKNINPYTLILSINLEPVYGIILALIIFGEQEKMPPEFYAGAFVILALIIAESYIKLKIKKAPA